MLAAAMKNLRALSLVVLWDAIAARPGSKPCIEMVLRFVVHLPLSKRPKVYTEEDTRPVAPEEEVAKIIAALILREIGFLGRVIIVGIPGGTLSRRGGSPHGDGPGRDLSGVAYLLRCEGVQPQAARWYQRYLQQVRVIPITAAGVSRSWIEVPDRSVPGLAAQSAGVLV